MYSTCDKFLYEILEDFQETQDESEKNIIFDAFMKSIWNSGNSRRVFTKECTFNIPSQYLNTEIGEIFYTHSSIPYVYYRSMTKNLDYASLIRQKINNIYTNMCDPKVCIKKEYMDLIKLPRTLFFRWIHNEEVFEPDKLIEILDNCLNSLPEIKAKYSKQKMNITWIDYKKLVTGFLRNYFDRFVALDKFEDKTKFILETELATEDNYCISYLCRSLDGEMKKYQKKYYGIRDHKKYGRCDCGNLFEKSSNRQKYCLSCKEKNVKKKYIKYNKTRNHH